MSAGGGTTTACAACRYQRRRCTFDCPLSPYFPPDQPQRFQNVHKLFGVSNILRILKQVDPSRRDDAVKSIAYEADARAQDPVNGCLGIVTVLEGQVAKLTEELASARQLLYLLEQQHNLNQQVQMQHFVAAETASRLGQTTRSANVSSSLQQSDTGALMQHLRQYDDMNRLAGVEVQDYAKSNRAELPVSTSGFEDEYLPHDTFDQLKAGSGPMSRYMVQAEESPLQQQEVGQVKVEQADRSLGRSTMHFKSVVDHDTGVSTFVDSSGNQALENLSLFHNDGDHESGEDARAPHTLALPGNGLVRLTVTSDAELRRIHGHGDGVPEHAPRSTGGVYLTLTNNL